MATTAAVRRDMAVDRRTYAGVTAAPASTPRRPLDAVAVVLGRSPRGTAALAPARGLAARLDADLLIISVTTTDSAAGAERDLEAAVQSARDAGLRARALHIATPDGGAPMAALLDGTAETTAGLLVLEHDVLGHLTDATNRADAHVRGGSVDSADALLARSRLPVLSIPRRFGARDGDGATHWIGWERATLEAVRTGRSVSPLRLLVALDGSPTGERTLPLAAGLFHSAGALLSLVRVVPASSALYCGASSTASAVDIGFRYLQRAAARLETDGVPPHAIRTAVRIGNAAEELLDQAAREQAAILMLARRGPTGHARPVCPAQSSLTLEVLRRALLPVLVVPALD